MRLPLTVVMRGLAVDEHAVGAVARDHIARATADDVPGGAGGHEDAVAGVAAVEAAGHVGADIVADDLVVRGAADEDAVASGCRR